MMKKRTILVLCGICLSLLVLFCSSVQAVVQSTPISPITLKVVAPDETLDAEKITVTVELTVPKDTEVYGLDVSLCYELRFFTVEAYTAQLQAPYPTGTLEKSDTEVRLLYDAQMPLAAGTYQLFSVEFAVKDITRDREAVFDLFVREAYIPIINDAGVLEYLDVPAQEEPARVFLGERLKITPSEVRLCAGCETQLSVNKAYTAVVNSNQAVVSFEEQTNTVTALTQGTAELVFYRDGESVSVVIQVYQPDPRLKSITLANAALTPQFSPDVYDYTANIPWDVQGLEIQQVQSMDGISTVLVENPSVEMGQSGEAVLTVMAENGTQKSYRITVMRGNKPQPAVPTQITSSVYGISDTALHQIATGTTVAAMCSGLNEREHITVYNANGIKANDNDIVGTGYQIKLPGGQVWSVIITGDVNGDGKITAADYVNVKFVVLGKQQLSDIYHKAADVNGDGKVTAVDYINIKFHVLGKTQITPR